MSASTEAVESGIKSGIVGLHHVIGLIENQFNGGSEVVITEWNYADHQIYISKALAQKLGRGDGAKVYHTLDDLVTQAFGSVKEIDKTKTRFWGPESYKIGEHQVLGCRIHYPEGSYRSVGETQAVFITSVERRLRLLDEQDVLGNQ